jgi:hypothetical protein
MGGFALRAHQHQGAAVGQGDENEGASQTYADLHFDAVCS